MLNIRRYADLGAMKNAWLNAHYHFSFADYHDPEFMGFGNLRVINDDIIAGHGGFGMHPHKDMEIITYVRTGAISHRDNLGNEGVIGAGQVQVMSAGTGIVHAEFNANDEEVNLYQIWILPRTPGVAPHWDQKAFTQAGVEGSLPLLVSGLPEHDAMGALRINADAAIYGGVIEAGMEITHAIRNAAYALVSKGSVILNGITMQKGDGATIVNEPMINIVAQGSAAEVVLIDLPNAGL